MSDELRPGDFVTSSVRLVRPIGQGGMGTVWLAENLQLDTRVVVKLMAHGLEHRADVLARFAREAMIAAQVKSPHVVQVFDTGTTENGVPYIVMELLEGKDLGKHLAEHGPMMPHTFVPIMVQLAKALAKAHRVGVVHRDLKPENVFLCENDHEPGAFVKLLDFGTAKVELPSRRDMTSTDTGQVLGTPLYMSPEQILGEKEIDHRSDIWSLGVVAFEALTGSTPFEGATIAALALAIHNTTPTLSAIVPEMPPEIDAWFARACAREKNDRFQSVREAADAFVVAATGLLPAEPIESMALRGITPRPPMVSDRPVMTTPLIDTLPKPGIEQRKVTVAAGVVIAAAVAISAIMIARAPAKADPPVAHEAPAAAPTTAPAPSPATPTSTPFEPEPAKLAEAPAPKPPKPNPPMLKGPKATYVPAKKSVVRPVSVTSSTAPAAPASSDDDLEKLSNIPPPTRPSDTSDKTDKTEKLPPPEIPAD